jgi:hypothetical protein
VFDRGDSNWCRHRSDVSARMDTEVGGRGGSAFSCAAEWGHRIVEMECVCGDWSGFTNIPFTIRCMTADSTGIETAMLNCGGSGDPDGGTAAYVRWSASEGENIAGLTVYTLQRDYHIVCGFDLILSTGRVKRVGSCSGAGTTIKAPSKTAVCGFRGRSGWVIDSLGLNFTTTSKPDAWVRAQMGRMTSCCPDRGVGP